MTTSLTQAEWIPSYFNYTSAKNGAKRIPITCENAIVRYFGDESPEGIKCLIASKTGDTLHKSSECGLMSRAEFLGHVDKTVKVYGWCVQGLEGKTSVDQHLQLCAVCIDTANRLLGNSFWFGMGNNILRFLSGVPAIGKNWYFFL